MTLCQRGGRPSRRWSPGKEAGTAHASASGRLLRFGGERHDSVASGQCESQDGITIPSTTGAAPMNAYLIAAAVLAWAVGVAHSILGERLIFSRLRQGRLVPTDGGTLLQERHVRILWASWHLPTLFGWVLAAALLRLASDSTGGGLTRPLVTCIAGGMLAGSVLVCYATRARHPGWIGLLGVAVLCWLGLRG